MREAELLNALGQNHGGVQVNIERGKVIVATRYANPPHVKVEADTLFEAAFKCAQKVLETVRKYPSFRQFCPKVIDALEAYDNHSGAMQL